MGCQGVYLYRSLARLLTVRRLLAQRSAYARPWAVRIPVRYANYPWIVTVVQG